MLALLDTCFQALKLLTIIVTHLAHLSMAWKLFSFCSELFVLYEV